MLLQNLHNEWLSIVHFPSGWHKLETGDRRVGKKNVAGDAVCLSGKWGSEACSAQRVSQIDAQIEPREIRLPNSL